LVVSPAYVSATVSLWPRDTSGTADGLSAAGDVREKYDKNMIYVVVQYMDLSYRRRVSGRNGCECIRREKNSLVALHSEEWALNYIFNLRIVIVRPGSGILVELDIVVRVRMSGVRPTAAMNQLQQSSWRRVVKVPYSSYSRACDVSNVTRVRRQHNTGHVDGPP